MSTRIETSRLIIRTFESRDAEAWIAMVNDPEVNRFLPPGPGLTMETFQEVIERRHAMEREIGYTMWAVDDKTTGTFVGQCGIRPVQEDAEPEIDLAYHYTRASWNKGYGTEAVIAVLAHGLGRSAWTASSPSPCRKTPAPGGSWRRPGCATKGWSITTGSKA